MSVNIKYKNNSIAELTDTGIKTLKTAGKYCEDDISVEYTKPAGGGGALIIVTDNLHDISTDIKDIYLEEGVEKPYSTWSATDYIPIKADTVYATQLVSNLSGKYCPMYDSDKNFVRNIDGGLQSTPDGVTLFFGIDGYIRFSGITKIINILKLYECTGSFEFDTEQSAVATLSDDIPAEMALDILTGGGPAE